MRITKITAKRFLSIGDDPVEIDFTQMGRVISIRGKNGSGKTTILEIIVFGLTGKLLRGTPKTAVNRTHKKGMRLELEFELHSGEKCRIERAGPPNSLRFWRGDQKYDLGMNETQAEINKATGFGYEALCNVAFFGQHNRYNFLSCDAETKRKIVESLLGLEKYIARCERAKLRRRDLEKDLQHNVKHLDQWAQQEGAAVKRLDRMRQQRRDWATRKAKDMEIAEAVSIRAAEALRDSDAGKAAAAYLASRGELRATGEALVKARERRHQIETAIQDARNEQTAIQTDLIAATVAAQKAIGDSDDLARQSTILRSMVDEARGLQLQEKCPTCEQGLLDGLIAESLTKKRQQQSDALAEKLLSSQSLANVNFDRKSEVQACFTARSVWITEAERKLDAVVRLQRQLERRDADIRAIPEPDGRELDGLKGAVAEADAKIRALQSEISAGDPYGDLEKEAERDLQAAKTEVAEHRELIREQEGTLPYYDYWVRGFGDDGIRSLFVADTVPPLNARVNYWLHCLMGGTVRLTFNAKLEERIESNPPNGDPYFYNGLSGGERQKIDLAISQAFAHVTMAACGGMLSLVSLDEVAANVDREAVTAVYQMIAELARQRQVLVITHNPLLLELLDTADILQVERNDGFTHIHRSVLAA